MEKNEFPISSRELTPEMEARIAKRKRSIWGWVIPPLMLAAGLLIGYFGRPIVSPEAKRAAGEVAPIVQLQLAQTRHWKGSPNAAVTMLEFSDFQ